MLTGWSGDAEKGKRVSLEDLSRYMGLAGAEKACRRESLLEGTLPCY